MKYIAIDIGSSFVKAAVVDVDAQTVVAMNKTPTPEKLPDPNPRHFENDASVFVELVEKLTRDYAKRFRDVAGILLATQMHGFVYAVPGRKDVYTSWQDMRCLDAGPDGRSTLERMEQLIPPEEMRTAGVYLKPSLALCNLCAMLDAQPDLPRTGTLHTLGSYIIKRLAGRNICHLSNAAPMGMADVAGRKWNRPLLARLGLDGIVLPELAENDFQVCGAVVSDGRELPIHPDWGDQQVAVLGCLAGPRDAVINIATGAQVVVPAGEFVPGPYETRPYFENGCFRTISNMPAGRGLDVIVNLLRQAAAKACRRDVDAADIWDAVMDGFTLEPDGLSVDMGIYPVSGKLGGGSIRGIRPDNFSLSALFSAAYLDMAATYWKHIQIMRPAEEIDRLVCAGGVSWKSPFLLEAIAGTSGKTCVRSPVADEAVAGMFRAALVCAGKARNLDATLDARLTFRHDGEGEEK